MNLIKHVKETQITDCYNKIIKFINTNIEDSSNVQYQKLQIADSISKDKYFFIDFFFYLCGWNLI